MTKWRKSSYSGYNGNCTEVAAVPEGGGYLIAVRDSKDPDGPVLTFTPGDWQEFTGRIKAAGA